MSRIVITGANGFVGRHVCRAAHRAGHLVVGMGHGDWPEETWRAWGLSEWLELDVTLSSLVAHADVPDAIVHCAGSGAVGFSLAHPAQDFGRTVATTLDVLEYIRTCSPGTAFVYPSSAAVYGVARHLPIAECAPRRPVSPYGVHKKIAEDLCQSYGRSFGVRVAMVRIFSAYGPELRKQLLWDACRKASRGIREFGGTGQETRDWIAIEDVAQLLLRAADMASPDAPIVNGATGEDIAIRDIVGLVFDTLGTTLPPIFTGVSRAGDPDRYAGDPTQAHAWGWEPVTGWRDGVRDYVRWFKEVYA